MITPGQIAYSLVRQIKNRLFSDGKEVSSVADTIFQGENEFVLTLRNGQRFVVTVKVIG